MDVKHQVNAAPPLPPEEIQHGDKTTLPPLYVLTVVSNPVRFNARYQLYKEFADRVAKAGAVLYTVELAFGQRPFALTDPDNPQHLRFRTDSELWHKENLVNLGISRLPADWQYVAWIDADTGLVATHWVNETIQQLQHYQVVQMFSHAVDLGPDDQPIAQHRGFVFGCFEDPGVDPDPGMAYGGIARPPGITGSLFHPGFAWAARKSYLDAIGGLYEHAVMGSADTYMARGFAGIVEGVMPEAAKGLTHGYTGSVREWQRRANRVLQRNFGYVPGLLTHYWHGKKKDRQYFDRNKVLAESRFDPMIDLVRDTRGVLRFGSNNQRLRDGLRGYFRARNEDSIDM